MEDHGGALRWLAHMIIKMTQVTIALAIARLCVLEGNAASRGDGRFPLALLNNVGAEMEVITFIFPRVVVGSGIAVLLD